MEYLSTGKIRRSESEWRELYTKYQSSGLSASKFCKQENIASSSFSKWVHKFGGAKAKSSPKPKSNFVEVLTPSEPIPAAKSNLVEFDLGNGQVLRVRL